MSMNIHSNNIRVFPTTLRESVDPAAKFTTEYNLTSLINKLLDRKAFVITDNLTGPGNIISQLDFNIMGYFFSVKKLNISSLIPESGDKTGYINAAIKVAYQPYTQTSAQAVNDTIFLNWSQLKLKSIEDKETLDETSIYTGVEFSFSTTSTLADKYGISSQQINTEPDPNTYIYTFTILKVANDGTISIPDESKIRFQTDMLNHHSVTIDDGDLDDPVQL